MATDTTARQVAEPGSPADWNRYRESTIDENAERATIGACLLDPEALDTAMETLKPEHFFQPDLGTLYSVLCDLRNEGRSHFDNVILASELQTRGLLTEIGGVGKLLDLFEAVPHSGHVAYYAGIVREKWRRRRAHRVGLDLSNLMADPTTDTDEALTEAEGLLCKTIDDSTTHGPSAISDVLVDALATLGTPDAPQRFIQTGYYGLDQVCGGFPLGGLTYIGARPSTGKTSLMMNIAIKCALVNCPALFCSYEQPKPEMAMRALSHLSSVPFTDIFKNRTTPEQNRRIVEEARYLGVSPFYLDCDCLSINLLLGMIRSHVRKCKTRLVMIDYLQLIESTNRKENREQQVAGISRALKRLAMQLNIAVVVASQLNRESEKREVKKPRLSDLRESGSIEQDADLVWLLWRPHITKDEGQVDDFGQVVVAKQRNGPLKDINLRWDGLTMTYRDSIVDPGQFGD